MKNLFSLSTLMVVFLSFAFSGAVAAGKNSPVSRSNVSNNKVNHAAGEVCDDGNTSDDCAKKVDKPYNADPYVEEGVVSPRDPASGLPTGKRMHKPVTVTAEVGTPAATTSSATATGDASVISTTSDASVPASSEGCCPGRCCPPEQSGSAAATPIRESPTEPPRGGDAASAMIQCPPGMTQTTLPNGQVGCKDGKGTQTSRLLPTVNKKTSASSEGCCPGRCCPPEQTTTDAAASTSPAAIECPPGTVPSGSAGCVPAAPASGDNMAINEKGLPGDKVRKPVKASK